MAPLPAVLPRPAPFPEFIEGSVIAPGPAAPPVLRYPGGPQVPSFAEFMAPQFANAPYKVQPPIRWTYAATVGPLEVPGQPATINAATANFEDDLELAVYHALNSKGIPPAYAEKFTHSGVVPPKIDLVLTDNPAACKTAIPPLGGVTGKTLTTDCDTGNPYTLSGSVKVNSGLAMAESIWEELGAMIQTELEKKGAIFVDDFIVKSGANDVKEAIMDGMEVSLFRAIASNAVLVTEKEISYEITGLPVTGLLGTCGTKIGDDFPTLQDENGFLDECDPTDPPAHVALELSGTIFIELTEPVTEIVFAEIIDDFLINLAKRSAKTDGITIKYFA
ncbi:unnamed protein product, partial [Mesorhabditis spiculigera]